MLGYSPWKIFINWSCFISIQIETFCILKFLNELVLSFIWFTYIFTNTSFITDELRSSYFLNNFVMYSSILVNSSSLFSWDHVALFERIKMILHYSYERIKFFIFLNVDKVLVKIPNSRAMCFFLVLFYFFCSLYFITNW